MELRLWTALGLLVVVTIGAVVGVTVIALVLPSASGGAAPAPDSGAEAQPPSIDAPEPGLVSRVFRYAVAFGLGGVVGLFLGTLVGQKAARSQPSVDGVANQYGDLEDRFGTAEDAGTADRRFQNGHRDPDGASGGPWESNR